MRVLKLGGNGLDRPGYVAKLAQTLRTSGAPSVLVHGGGAEIDRLQLRLGQTPVKLHGMRRTDAETLEVVLMTLSGLVNKRLVAALIAHGVDAVGLSGMDGGLLRCRKLQLPDADLGFVGEVVSVRAAWLETLLKGGFTPVVSPVSLGEDGMIYNVNADLAAASIAMALGAPHLDLVSDVPGVFQRGALVPRLSPVETDALISSGEIEGGMLPKVHAAMMAVRGGVNQARIVDLAGFNNGGGTTFEAPAASRGRPPAFSGGKR